MFEDAITLFHTIDNETFHRIVIDKVYFKNTTGIIDNSTEIGNNKSGVIVIPRDKAIVYEDYTYDDLEDGHYKDILDYTLEVSPNDYVIEGMIEDEWNFKELMNKYYMYKVISASKNFHGNLQHYKILVQG